MSRLKSSIRKHPYQIIDLAECISGLNDLENYVGSVIVIFPQERSM